MVPTDLLKLIDKYNELGFFTSNNECIYWCNGKRFEFWHKGDTHMLLYSNLCVENPIYIYEHHKFVSTKLMQWYYIYKLSNITIIANSLWINFDTLYCYNNYTYCNTNSIITKPTTSYAIKAFKNFIYCFSKIENYKYDTIQCTWSKFAYSKSTYKHIYSLKDQFYCQCIDDAFDIYDITTDQYSSSGISFPLPIHSSVSVN